MGGEQEQCKEQFATEAKDGQQSKIADNGETEATAYPTIPLEETGASKVAERLCML